MKQIVKVLSADSAFLHDSNEKMMTDSFEERKATEKREKQLRREKSN
jgi:hypothetical protein